MRTRLVTFLMLCTIFSCASAKVADTEKQNRETGTFRKIQVSAGIDVYFTQEKPQNIRVETENVDVNDVVTEVKNETLIVKMKDRWRNSLKKKSIKVYVSAPELEGISTSGGSDFYADNLKSPDFSISTSGGSDVHIGTMRVERKIEIATSGGSDCEIKNLKTINCRIATSGGSDVKIGMEVSGELAVAASGGSDVNLSGKADKLSISASGAADVHVKKLEYRLIESKASGGADIHK